MSLEGLQSAGDWWRRKAKTARNVAQRYQTGRGFSVEKQKWESLKLKIEVRY